MLPLLVSHSHIFIDVHGSLGTWNHKVILFLVLPRCSYVPVYSFGTGYSESTFSGKQSAFVGIRGNDRVREKFRTNSSKKCVFDLAHVKWRRLFDAGVPVEPHVIELCGPRDEPIKLVIPARRQGFAYPASMVVR